MTSKCRNGDEIELGWGDTYPPGHVGQHTNVNRVWIRVPEGEWVAAPSMSLLKTILLVESYESAAELIAALRVRN